MIENTTISGNEVSGDGGGIDVDGVYGDGDLTIRSSTISDNRAFYGGGIQVENVDGNTLIENTTISGNEAAYDGGGVYFGYLYDDQTATIRNSTIVDNVAAIDPGEYGDYAGGGVYLYDDSEDTTVPIVENGPLNISSTIIANNSADSGNDLGQGEFADGFVVGFSLAESNSGATIVEEPGGLEHLRSRAGARPAGKQRRPDADAPAGDHEPGGRRRRRPTASPPTSADCHARAILRRSQTAPDRMAPTSARPSCRRATSRLPARAASGESSPAPTTQRR